jgi:hypothetical protein
MQISGADYGPVVPSGVSFCRVSREPRPAMSMIREQQAAAPGPTDPRR